MQAITPTQYKKQVVSCNESWRVRMTGRLVDKIQPHRLHALVTCPLPSPPPPSTYSFHLPPKLLPCLVVHCPMQYWFNIVPIKAKTKQTRRKKKTYNNLIIHHNMPFFFRIPFSLIRSMPWSWGSLVRFLKILTKTCCSVG